MPVEVVKGSKRGDNISHSTSLRHTWSREIHLPLRQTILALGLAAQLASAQEPSTNEVATNSTPLPATPSNTNKLVLDPQKIGQTLISAEETIELLKDGRLKKEVGELPVGNDFTTFIFQWSDKELAKKFPNVALSGVSIKGERKALLLALRENGAVIDQEAVAGYRQMMRQYTGSLGILQYIFPVVMTVYMVLMLRRMGGFDKTAKGQQFEGKPEERFTDIGGLSEVVGELAQLKKDIKDKADGVPNIRLPKGIILHGVGGTGKTSLARALAGEADCSFYYYDSSQLLESSFVGVWSKAVSRLFADARRTRDRDTKKLKLKTLNPKAEAVVIVFVDEFDSLGMQRDKDGGGVGREYRKVVNKLLAEMDSIDRKRNRNIILVGALNDITVIDPSLLRPGRFSRVIPVPLPRTSAERVDIATKLAAGFCKKEGLTIEDQGSLEMVAKLTPGCSGDVIRAIVEHAIQLAQRDKDRKNITFADLLEGVQTNLFGAKILNLLDKHGQKITMRHEAGHGLLAVATGTRMFGLSNIARGNSAGRLLIDGDSLLSPPTKRSALLKAMVLYAGGRSAEILGTGIEELTDGASQDLANLRKIAQRLIGLGMVGERFDVNTDDTNPASLPERHRDLIHSLIHNALKTSDQVLKIIGKDRLEKITGAALALDKELLGPEVEAFLFDQVKEEERKAMTKIVDAFIQNPLEQEQQAAAQESTSQP